MRVLSLETSTILTSLEDYWISGCVAFEEVTDAFTAYEELVARNGTHETLALPQPDLPFTSGWIWEVYSKQRVQDRLRTFFLWCQISFHEMVKNNFPRMKEYFPLYKDSPYKYRIHVKFKVTKDFTSDPSITYYRISQKGDEDNTLEIITDGPYPEPDNEEIFNMIMSSHNLNRKESDNVSITSTGFDMTLTSRHSGANMPLTSCCI